MCVSYLLVELYVWFLVELDVRFLPHTRLTRIFEELRQMAKCPDFMQRLLVTSFDRYNILCSK